jgi:hypothetical protein
VASSSFTQLSSLAITGTSIGGTFPAAFCPALNALPTGGTCVLAGNQISCAGGQLPSCLTRIACSPGGCALSGDASAYCGAGDDPVQCAVLVDLAQALGLQGWTSSYANTWLQGGSYCSWPGVQCDQGVYGCCESYPGQFTGYGAAISRLGVNCSAGGACGYAPVYGGSGPARNGTVVGLSLPTWYGSSVNCQGTLPASFGSLSYLASLTLGEAGIVGTLPASFASLTRLQTLELRNLRINGSLDVLALLPALATASLMQLYSGITGALPNFVSQKLTSITLSTVYLYESSPLYTGGYVPPSMPLPGWNLPSLSLLTLDTVYVFYSATPYEGNAMMPTTPGKLSLPSNWNLPKLTSLAVSNSPNLAGPFPAAAAFPSLASLTLSSCGLTGALPPLPDNLTVLSISGCSFSGGLPALPAGLSTISIANTPFTGDLAAVASSSFTQLSSLAITGTSIGGTFPAAFCPALNALPTGGTCVLAGNQISCAGGQLPSCLTRVACSPGGSTCSLF